jgi:GNAT superfamily N-acetyltransferase
MSYDVRSATDSDLEGLRAVYRRASLSNDGDRAALLAHPDVLLWQPAGEIPAGTRLATDVGGRIVGFATVVGSDPVLELEDLFVDPDSRRRGIARLLIQDAVVRAGSASIEVTANPHAAEFYAATGFTWVDDTETPFGPAPRLRRTGP